jgi:L-ascorbate metabolism protein UlaG (beta-lactamase superfamily)
VTERHLTTAAAPIPRRRAGAAEGAALSAWWLGQAGFLVEARGVRLVVDAYLSDSLAVKNRGKPYPHVRMMPPPVGPGELLDVDLVLATHAHTDHLDPGTLGPLAAANPRCRFVVPAAHAGLAVSRGVPADRLVAAHALADLEVAGVLLRPLPSAHEELAVDAAGDHLHLGYLVEVPGGGRLYHSGDCVPYPELAGHLAASPPDLALLPVNGRDARRAAGGVPGNFDLAEAMALAEAVRPGAVIGHHFGMFDFNTIDPVAARAAIAARRGLPPFLLAEVGVRYDLRPRPGPAGRGGVPRP